MIGENSHAVARQIAKDFDVPRVRYLGNNGFYVSASVLVDIAR